MPSAVRAPTRPRPLRARLGTRFILAAGSGIVGRTATVAETASGTSITGTRPANRQTGDYVIAQFSMSCTVAQFTGPGGSWVQLVPPTDDGAAQIVAVYGMFDPASDPVGTTSAVAGRHTCIMQAYGGVDPTTPIDVAAPAPTVGTMPITVPQITTVTAGARLICGATGNFSTGTWTYPAEMALVAYQSSGVGRGAALADEVRPVVAATGSRQWASSAGALAAVGYLLALRPAPMPVVREYLSGEASATNITVTTGAGTVAGDLILVFHSNDFNTAANLTPPTTGSWTLQATGDSGNVGATAGSHVKVWSGSAAGGAQAITVAPSVSGEEHGLHVVVFAGACTVDGAAGGNGTATTLQVSPAVSTAGSPRLLFSAVTSNGTVAGNYTPPPGMAEGTELDDATFAFTASLGSETLPNSGSTGTRTWTYSSAAGVYATVSIAVKGVAAAGGAAASGAGLASTRTTTAATGQKSTTSAAAAATRPVTAAAAVKTAAGAAGPTVRAVTAATGRKQAAAAAAPTQHSTTQTTGQKQAAGPGQAVQHSTTQATFSPAGPSGAAAAIQRTATQATGGKQATGAATAPARAVTAAAGRKQSAAAPAAVQRGTTISTGGKQTAGAGAAPTRTASTSAGRKQAAAPGAASARAVTQSQGGVFVGPNGPASAAVRTATAATGKAGRAGTGLAQSRTATAGAGKRAAIGAGAASVRPGTAATGLRGAAGTARAAQRSATASTGVLIPAFIPAYVGVDAGTGTTTLDGATRSGALDTATVGSGAVG